MVEEVHAGAAAGADVVGVDGAGAPASGPVQQTGAWMLLSNCASAVVLLRYLVSAGTPHYGAGVGPDGEGAGAGAGAGARASGPVQQTGAWMLLSNCASAVVCDILLLLQVQAWNTLGHVQQNEPPLVVMVTHASRRRGG